MSDSGTTARPRQLTMAGWFVVGGSIFLLLSAFDTITTLNTLDARDGGVLKLLTAPGGVNLDLGTAITAARVMLTVGAVCAAAAAVLGFFVLQRNHGARIVLSILAVPILFTGLLTGGVIGALVAAATVMLWSGPARDWFAGRPVREVGRPERTDKSGPWETTMPRQSERNHPPEQPSDPVPPSDDPPHSADTPADRQTPAASSLSTAGSSTEPGAMSGFGQSSAPVVDQPTASWPPHVGAPSYANVRPAMPGTVKAACILTWVFSGMVALLYAGMLVFLAVAQDRVVDAVVKTPAWERANIQQDVLVPALWLGALLFLAWAVGACVLALFTWRRHNWARWMLASSAASVLLIGFLAFPVGVVHQLAAALVIAGLFGSSARAWFANDNWSQGPPPPGYQGGYQGGYPGDQSWQQQPHHPERPPEDVPQHPDHGQQPPPGGKPPVW